MTLALIGGASNSLFWLSGGHHEGGRRHAEAIGADIARGEQAKVDRSVSGAGGAHRPDRGATGTDPVTAGMLPRFRYKTVIGSRLKQSGMFWTERGADAVIGVPMPGD